MMSCIRRRSRARSNSGGSSSSSSAKSSGVHRALVEFIPRGELGPHADGITRRIETAALSIDAPRQAGFVGQRLQRRRPSRGRSLRAASASNTPANFFSTGNAFAALSRRRLWRSADSASAAPDTTSRRSVFASSFDCFEQASRGRSKVAGCESSLRRLRPRRVAATRASSGSKKLPPVTASKLRNGQSSASRFDERRQRRQSRRLIEAASRFDGRRQAESRKDFADQRRRFVQRAEHDRDVVGPHRLAAVAVEQQSLDASRKLFDFVDASRRREDLDARGVAPTSARAADS